MQLRVSHYEVCSEPRSIGFAIAYQNPKHTPCAFDLALPSLERPVTGCESCPSLIGDSAFRPLRTLASRRV